VVETGGHARASERTGMKTNWSDGVMEWWSDGSGSETQYSSTTLRYSKGLL
jgi:hypothetical protein